MNPTIGRKARLEADSAFSFFHAGGQLALQIPANGEDKNVTVLRIVANLKTDEPEAARTFYETLLGLDVVMDHGWIITFGAETSMKPQLSIAREGGSGSEVPDISIEVDNVDDVHAAARAAGFTILYPLTDEPWGVRRFYVRDPLGKVVNILGHLAG